MTRIKNKKEKSKKKKRYQRSTHKTKQHTKKCAYQNSNWHALFLLFYWLQGYTTQKKGPKQKNRFEKWQKIQTTFCCPRTLHVYIMPKKKEKMKNILQKHDKKKDKKQIRHKTQKKQIIQKCLRVISKVIY